MKRTVFALSAVLVAQVALTAGVTLSHSGLSAPAPTAPLLNFKPSAVKSLTVVDGNDKTSITLTRSDKGWVLPNQGNFPASKAEVNGVLRDLTQARQGAPVATSADALKRFEVSKDTFERKITFKGKNGKTLTTLYLGTSQGARQVHARRSDQKTVQRIDFSVWKAPSDADEWTNKTLLEVHPDTITKLSWDGVTLTHQASGNDTSKETPKKNPQNGQPNSTATATAAKAATPAKTASHWVMEGQTKTPLPQTTITPVTDALSRLRILGLVAKEDQASFNPDHPILSIQITGKKGGKTYALYKTADKTPHYAITSSAITSSGHPQMMTVAAVEAQSVLKTFAKAKAALTGVPQAAAKSKPTAAVTKGAAPKNP